MGHRPIRVFVGTAQVLVHNAYPCLTLQQISDAINYVYVRGRDLNKTPGIKNAYYTVAFGVAQDEEGVLHTLVGISKPNSKFPQEVLAHLEPMDILVQLQGHVHGEINVIQEAQNRRWRLVAVGATNGICGRCVPEIAKAKAFAATKEIVQLTQKLFQQKR